MQTTLIPCLRRLLLSDHIGVDPGTKATQRHTSLAKQVQKSIACDVNILTCLVK